MFRAQIVLVVVLAAAIAALPWFFDVVGIAQDVRTWVIETFGLGLIIVAAVLLAWAITAWRGSREERLLFWRRILGYPVLAFFAWGALGLNTADWTVAGVPLRDVTLGGEIGHTIVTGWINVLVWIASAVVALALLAPHSSLTALRYSGRGVAYAWERRWPHQVLASFWRGLTTVAGLFRRRKGAGSPVIGGSASQPAGPNVEFEASPHHLPPACRAWRPTRRRGRRRPPDGHTPRPIRGRIRNGRRTRPGRLVRRRPGRRARSC